MTLTVPELAEELTSRQKFLLEQTAQARSDKHKAADAYAHSMMRAYASGVSYGIIAWRLGISKEAAWRQCRRFSESRTKMDQGK